MNQISGSTTATSRSGSGINSGYLTFQLGGEEYGIDILAVQEIRGYGPVTHLANMPAFIKGVVNLRSNIVPILDLRVKFNLERVEYNETTVVIIVHAVDRVVGLVVDSVSDVVALEEGQIKAPPNLGSTIDITYIQGIATVEERLLLLLDIQRLLSSTDGILSTAAAAAEFSQVAAA
jgi:purine-binding chemotaxis protein CheW